MSGLRWFLWGVALTAVLTAPRAGALDYCVSTAAELEAALLVAGLTSAPGGVTIRLVQGTYELGGTAVLDAEPFGYDIKSRLELLGGYTAACAGRSVNPTNTVVTNSGNQRLNWKQRAPDLTIDGLSFRGFSGGFLLRVWNVEIARMSLSNIEFRSIAGFVSRGMELSCYISEEDCEIRLVNALITGRDASCALRIDDPYPEAGDSSVTLINTTVAGNTGPAPSAGGVCLDGLIEAGLFNNIFYGNGGGIDLNVTGTAVRFYQNTIQARQATMVLVDQGSLNTDPSFVGGGNYRLQVGSNAVNSGTAVVPGGLPGFDIEGNQRLVGPAPDRGAYESSNAGTVGLTVTNTNDSGTGSLRQAVIEANGTPGTNVIGFNIGGGGCPKSISLATPLPDVTETLIVSGAGQPGYVPNTIDYGYNGTQCVVVQTANGSVTHALLVPASAADSVTLTVDALAFGGFTLAPVRLEGGRNHRITGSHFGVNGTTALPSNNFGLRVSNNATGVVVGGPDARARNVIGNSNNTGLLFLTHFNYAFNNFIGTDAHGSMPAPNDVGIRVTGNSAQVKDNWIAGNLDTGIELAGSDAIATGNRIGFKRSPFCALFGGSCALPNGGYGIEITGPAYNWASFNRIANQQAAGIRVAAGNGHRLTNNEIYANAGPEVDIGNPGFDSIDDDTSAPVPGNSGLNWPEVLETRHEAGGLAVRVRLRSGNGRYYLNLNTSDACDLWLPGSPRGHGGGAIIGADFIDISNATAGVNGSSEIWITVPGSEPRRRWLSAYAIRDFSPDPAREYSDTSEYGNCLLTPLLSDSFEGP